MLQRTHTSSDSEDSEDAANEHDVEGVQLRFHYPEATALASASLKGSKPKKGQHRNHS